ncbi:hypothetical protein BDR05DRAFT_999770 [Suillus weaverae]|nr:hypothetical protein BDR05DRAFT_999770 [Suillus weaverae]
MATKAKVFDDSKPVTDSLPPYDKISTFVSSADSMQCTGRPSIFSFIRNKAKRTTVLSCIRDIVSAPDFSSSSIISSVNACVAAISPAEFSDLLQKPDIEGHTAMYWAILNHRREAFSAFAAFIANFSSVCTSDLRLACMSTSDHVLFTQMKLGRVINPKDESLRNFLGCPPDEVQVHDTGDGLRKCEFVVCFRIRMFQKRLLVRRELGIEFVAAGRIWLLRLLSTASDGLWRIFLTLSKESLPVRPEVVLVIEAHSGKPDCATPPQDLRVPRNNRSVVLAPKESATGSDITSFTWRMKDWLMNE